MFIRPLGARVFFFFTRVKKKGERKRKRIQKLLIRSPQRDAARKLFHHLPSPQTERSLLVYVLIILCRAKRKVTSSKVERQTARWTLWERTRKLLPRETEGGIREKDSKHRNKCLYWTASDRDVKWREYCICLDQRIRTNRYKHSSWDINILLALSRI